MAVTAFQPQPRFISLRWRFLLPLFVVVLAGAMAGAYFLGGRLTGSMEVPQVNMLLESTRAISASAADLYQRDRGDAQAFAYTRGLPALIEARDAEALAVELKVRARLSGLDSAVLTDATGAEIVGLLRVDDDYALSRETDLSAEAVVRAVLDDAYIGATGLVSTPQGYLLYTAVPVYDGRKLVGVMLAGRRLHDVLSAFGRIADLALYGQDGALLQTSFETTTPAVAGLALDQQAFTAALTASGGVTLRSLDLGGTAYRSAYVPFVYGPNTVGLFAVLLPDNSPFMNAMGRQLTGLTMASLAGLVVMGAFVGINLMVVSRVNRVTRTAQTLAAGNPLARTAMKAADEIGAMGRALDQYADYVQERQDTLRVSLRRQRREAEHLLAVLESMPDGIVVQDNDGRVIVMNDQAKRLIGSDRVFRESALGDLTAVVTDALGAALAPGLYALGDPTRVELDGRMLSAVAAAVTDISNQRVGTVIVLRDITSDIRRERAYDAMLHRVERDVQKPMAAAAQREAAGSMDSVARELTRHAVALQKLVVEMRELTMAGAPEVREEQRPLHLETLLWTVANEWRQVATAANLSMEVIIERKGLHVLGDERRLRWAMGNIVDNAIKYTPPGGKLTLEIQGDSSGRANLRVRDNGVGITADDLPHIFTRFYRGKPVTEAGRMLNTPGTGQGLSTARQIIEAHGGQIQIKSKPGVGTAVYFSLPLTSHVSYELPQLPADLDGETVRIDDKRRS